MCIGTVGIRRDSRERSFARPYDKLRLSGELATEEWSGDVKKETYARTRQPVAATPV